LPSKGHNIKYIYTDAQHSNPLCRVTPVNVTKRGVVETVRYDRDKYREMMLDAAQTVLGYFGFDRTVYGDKRSMAPRKWRHQDGNEIIFVLFLKINLTILTILV
jgi:hypothetical protein